MLCIVSENLCVIQPGFSNILKNQSRQDATKMRFAVIVVMHSPKKAFFIYFVD